jgi:hypothetical protein
MKAGDERDGQRAPVDGRRTRRSAGRALGLGNRAGGGGHGLPVFKPTEAALRTSTRARALGGLSELELVAGKLVPDDR